MPEQKEYSFEIVERAEELYCVDGLTYDQVASEMGIAQSTLKRWGKKYNWAAKREEIRQALSSIRVNKIKLRAELIKNCLETLAPMDAFAVAKIEDIAIKAQELKQETPKEVKIREIKTREDAVAALSEAIEIRLNQLLSLPEQLDFKALKDLRQAIELVEEMKPDKDGKIKKQGLTPEMADQFRKQILGIQ